MNLSYNRIRVSSTLLLDLELSFLQILQCIIADLIDFVIAIILMLEQIVDDDGSICYSRDLQSPRVILLCSIDPIKVMNYM